MAILNSSLKRENESWLIKNQTEQGIQDVGEVSYTVSDEGCNFNITKRNGFDEVMSNPTDKAAVQKTISEMHQRFIEKSKNFGYFV